MPLDGPRPVMPNVGINPFATGLALFDPAIGTLPATTALLGGSATIGSPSARVTRNRQPLVALVVYTPRDPVPVKAGIAYVPAYTIYDTGIGVGVGTGGGVGAGVVVGVGTGAGVADAYRTAFQVPAF